MSVVEEVPSRTPRPSPPNASDGGDGNSRERCEGNNARANATPERRAHEERDADGSSSSSGGGGAITKKSSLSTIGGKLLLPRKDSSGHDGGGVHFSNNGLVSSNNNSEESQFGEQQQSAAPVRKLPGRSADELLLLPSLTSRAAGEISEVAKTAGGEAAVAVETRSALRRVDSRDGKRLSSGEGSIYWGWGSDPSAK